MYYFCLIFIVFFIYSFLGYLMEVLSCSMIDGRLNLSRGYFIGPYLPIFGFGSLLSIVFLQKYQNDVVVLFVLSIVICCLLEYFTSLILEKIFGLRWWDYSNKKFHINGRVCLETGIYFGIAGIVIIRYFHPFLMSLLLPLSTRCIILLGSIFFVLFFVDFCISTFTISKLKIDMDKYASRDATSLVKKEVLESLERYRIFYKRLFIAFPDISKNKGIRRIRELIEEQRRKTK